MSLRHVVCFRFHPGTTSEQVDALAASLRELPGLIPEIDVYRVGPDLGINPTSWDFTVNADFTDEAAYLVYRDHPEHQKRIEEKVVPLTAERVAVQFTI